MFQQEDTAYRNPCFDDDDSNDQAFPHAYDDNDAFYNEGNLNMQIKYVLQTCKPTSVLVTITIIIITRLSTIISIISYLY